MTFFQGQSNYLLAMAPMIETIDEVILHEQQTFVSTYA